MPFDRSAATAAGALLAIPLYLIGIRRLRGDYQAMAMLVLSLIATAFADAQGGNPAGGPTGISFVPKPLAVQLPLTFLGYQWAYLGFVAVITLIVLDYALYRLIAVRPGTAGRARQRDSGCVAWPPRQPSAPYGLLRPRRTLPGPPERWPADEGPHRLVALELGCTPKTFLFLTVIVVGGNCQSGWKRARYAAGADPDCIEGTVFSPEIRPSRAHRRTRLGGDRACHARVPVVPPAGPAPGAPPELGDFPCRGQALARCSAAATARPSRSLLKREPRDERSAGQGRDRPRSARRVSGRVRPGGDRPGSRKGLMSEARPSSAGGSPGALRRGAGSRGSDVRGEARHDYRAHRAERCGKIYGRQLDRGATSARQPGASYSRKRRFSAAERMRSRGSGLRRTFQTAGPLRADDGDGEPAAMVPVCGTARLSRGTLARWLERHRREAELARRALATMREFGVVDLADELAANLSGGQKRIVEIMRTMMGDPIMMLLDEPLAGINPTLALKISDRLRAIRDTGVTMIMIEHDLGIVEELCDPVIVMAQGRVLSQRLLSDLRRKQGGCERLPHWLASAVKTVASPYPEANELSAGYDTTLILNSVSASVGQGEIACIVGPNGSGKSTLVKAVTGDLPALRTGRSGWAVQTSRQAA